jgi:hypothetical protein
MTGLLMHAIVHAADIQDRDGGALVITTLFGLYPFLLKIYADGGYQGPVFRNAVEAAMAELNVEIVKRSDQAKGFVLLPKRWAEQPEGSARDCAWNGCGGGRTNTRLAEPLPSPRERLGVPEPKSPRLCPACIHPAHAAKAR